MSQEHRGPVSPVSRRSFLLTSGALAAAPALSASAQAAPPPKVKPSDVAGTEHWTTKLAGADKIKLFLWRKRLRTPPAGGRQGTILFVHGSSISATPAFDLQIPGRPECSVMDWFARKGYDTWCVDCEGYGRSDKARPINADVSTGADDLTAAAAYIIKETGDKPMVYGESSGGLRAALFAQRHPEQVKRLVLDAFVWTGEGSPTLTERRKKLAQFQASNRRPIDRDFVRSIFTRDHPGTSDQTIVEAFADAVLALDNSAPTGTYVDMCSKLPLVDPEKLAVPTLILRGQFDGIATFDDLSRFFAKLPGPDKQLIVMPGIAHSSTRSKNFTIVYHLLDGYFSQPAPVYVG
ncbi:MAG: lysophospholipase [Deltaproteobacteria bacterium]|nr:MAG: lysophospholipase [Deltaproteobacteria bacterium]TMQ25513.1 MAG: lysophospholipase [Deltaproteobacteria bacterium]